MDYTHYLKKTYLKNIQVGRKHKCDCDFVLVNYNSQDDMAEWVKNNLQQYLNSGLVTYFHTKEPEQVNMSKGKNMAHKLATGDILVNLDADNFLTKGYIDWVVDLFNRRDDVVTQGRGHGCGGRVAVRREDFEAVGGYDEMLNRPGGGIDHNNFCFNIKGKFNKEIIIVPSKLCPFLEQTQKEKDKLMTITYLDIQKHELNNR